MSVFAQYQSQAYPYRFAGQLHVGTIAGGGRYAVTAWERLT